MPLLPEEEVQLLPEVEVPLLPEVEVEVEAEAVEVDEVDEAFDSCSSLGANC